jgi:hypothetical protein
MTGVIGCIDGLPVNVVEGSGKEGGFPQQKGVGGRGKEDEYCSQPWASRFRGLKARKRRQGKPLKVREGLEQFSIPVETNLERIKMLNSRAVVGRLEFTNGDQSEILDWVRKNWVPICGDMPRVMMLLNRWVLIIFTKPEQVRFMKLECGMKDSLLIDGS